MKSALAAVVAAALLPTGAASAAPALTPAESGTVVFKLTGSARDSLSGKGVRFSALAPATTSGAERRLPISAGYIGSYSLVQAGGTLRLRTTKRGRTYTAELRQLQVKLGKHPVITALIGQTRLTMFDLAPKAGTSKTDAAGRSIALTTGAPATLTRTGATTLARILHVSSMPRRAFAMVRFSAALTAAAAASPSAPANPTGPATTPTTPGTPAGTPAAPSGCPLAPGGAAADPGPGTPPVLARPEGAMDITAATITWNVRDSFIQYINTGEGTAVSGGATEAPAAVHPGSSTALHYTFGFPFRNGWCDAAGGKAALHGTGAVRFRFSGHGIDLTTASPEVELTGTAARIIFDITNEGTTARQIVATLDLSHAAAISISADGRTTTYDRIPAAIPPGAANTIFAGFYSPGEAFGSVSISFTTT